MQIIAHRGASRAERENTLDAFRRAAALGADAVELDVRRSADGVLVVHHDPHVTLEGTAIAVSDLAAAELPDHVPTLAAAIEACAGMWVNVEIKNDPDEPGFEADDRLADDTLAVLAHAGPPQRWVVSSFRLETIDRCRAVDPRVRTAWLTSIPTDDVVERIVEGGHHAWHPKVQLLGRHHVEVARAHGVVVNTWTCDDPTRMAELLSWGVHGVCTNVPDVAFSVRAAALAPGVTDRRGATTD